MRAPPDAQVPEGKGGQGRFHDRRVRSQARATQSCSPVAHVHEALAVDSKELLPVRLLQLVREAIQEVVHAWKGHR